MLVREIERKYMEDFEERLVARFERVLHTWNGEKLGETWAPTVTATTFVDTDQVEPWIRYQLNHPTGKIFVLLSVTYHPGYSAKYWSPNTYTGEDPIAHTCSIVLLALGLGLHLHWSEQNAKGFYVFMRREEDVYQQLPPIEDLRTYT